MFSNVSNLDQSSIFKDKYTAISKKTYQMIKNHNEGLTRANPFSDCLPSYVMVPKTTDKDSSPKSLDLLKERRRSHALAVMR